MPTVKKYKYICFTVVLFFHVGFFHFDFKQTYSFVVHLSLAYYIVT